MFSQQHNKSDKNNNQCHLHSVSLNATEEQHHIHTTNVDASNA